MNDTYDTLSGLLLGTNNVRGNTSSTQDLFVTGVLHGFLKGFQTNDLLIGHRGQRKCGLVRTMVYHFVVELEFLIYDLAIRTCCPSFHLCNSLTILMKFSQLQC